MRQNRQLLLFLLFLLLCFSVGGLHLAFPEKRSGLTLSIITPHGDPLRQEMGQAFSDWHERHFGLRASIKWIDQGGTSDALRFVQGRFRGSPAGIGIDLFFGGGASPFRALAAEGLLSPAVFSPPLAVPVPAELRGVALSDPAAGWYGAALSGFGFVFNRELLRRKGRPEPRSWADLARPEAFGEVASVDPRGSGSAHVIYEIVLQKYGWEKGFSLLTRIAANSRHFTKGASGVLPYIAAGDAAYAIAIDQYGLSLVEEVGAERVAFVLPEGETVLTPDPVAVLKGAPNKEAADRFITFLLGETAQRIWMYRPGVPGGPRRYGLHRMSVLPPLYAGLGALTLVKQNPFSDSAARASAGESKWTYSESLTEKRWVVVGDLLGLYMVDHHEEAARAWRNWFEAHPGQDPAGHPFFTPPVTAEELSALSERWKDPEFRNEKMAEWSRRLGQVRAGSGRKP